jgi:hypothetical protein
VVGLFISFSSYAKIEKVGAWFPSFFVVSHSPPISAGIFVGEGEFASFFLSFFPYSLIHFPSVTMFPVVRDLRSRIQSP